MSSSKKNKIKIDNCFIISDEDTVENESTKKKKEKKHKKKCQSLVEQELYYDEEEKHKKRSRKSSKKKKKVKSEEEYEDKKSKKSKKSSCPQKNNPRISKINYNEYNKSKYQSIETKLEEKNENPIENISKSNDKNKKETDYELSDDNNDETAIKKHNKYNSDNFDKDYYNNNYFKKVFNDYINSFCHEGQNNRNMNQISKNRYLTRLVKNSINKVNDINNIVPKSTVYQKFIEIQKKNFRKKLIEKTEEKLSLQKKSIMRLFINFGNTSVKNISSTDNINNKQSLNETFQKNYSNLKKKINNLNYSEYNYTLTENDYFIVNTLPVETILTSEEAAIKKCEIIFNQTKEKKLNNWMDPHFGPQNENDDGNFTSIYGNVYFGTPKDHPDPKKIGWYHISEISEKPVFYKGSEVVQGRLGNYWFISAMACVAKSDCLFYGECNSNFFDEADISDNQIEALSLGVYPPLFHSFRKLGIFCFRFFKNAKWIYVIVDGRLPCYKIHDKTETPHLIFSKCKDKNEFWLPLIEKAYAKLHGSYIALTGGNIYEGIRDLTGLVPRYIDLINEVFKQPEKKDAFWEMLKKKTDKYYNNKNNENKNTDNENTQLLTKNKIIMGCLIKMPGVKLNKKNEICDEDGTPTGLFAGIVYSILDAFEIPKLKSKNICQNESKIHHKNKQIHRLLRLKNNHSEYEWKGSWRNDSHELFSNRKNILKYLEQKYGNKTDKIYFSNKASEDDTFFICYRDFRKYFNCFFICESFPNNFVEVRFIDHWPKKSGGFPSNNNPIQNFFNNCQYYINLKTKKKISINLSQEDIRLKGINLDTMTFDNSYQYISIFIFKTNEKKSKNDFTEQFGEVICMPTRDIYQEMEFEPGQYIIIPTTKDKGKSKEFEQFCIEFHFQDKNPSINMTSFICEDTVIEKLRNKPDKIELINRTLKSNYHTKINDKKNLLLNNLKNYVESNDDYYYLKKKLDSEIINRVIEIDPTKIIRQDFVDYTDI